MAPVAAVSRVRAAEFLEVLAGVQADLNRHTAAECSGMRAVSHAFKSLASQAETVLKQASAIVCRIENESMAAVLPQVQSLSETVRGFLAERWEATEKILGALEDQEKLLRQLILVSNQQDAVAAHLRALSVLTNVEVSHLGSGGNFQLLADELSRFSRSLAGQTSQLSSQTEQHRQKIEETRRELCARLPQLRAEIDRMEQDIDNTLRMIDGGRQEQMAVPEQFRKCAEETSQQIGGVVAAIQTQDITRQQLEHVQHALRLIAGRIEAGEGASARNFPAICAGLHLQICQLRNLGQSLSNWTAHLRRCMHAIQQLSASEVARIGPTVLDQESQLSAQLVQLEQLQKKSRNSSERMQSTLSGVSNLVGLVEEHLKRARRIRDRLHVLMFNSQIEAGRLGRHGVVVASIASLIKGVSADWTGIAEQSRSVLSRMLALAQETSRSMEVFSEAGGRKLEADQAETARTLNRVREAGAFVAREAQEMKAVTEGMRRSLSGIEENSRQLDESSSHLENATRRLEALAAELEKIDPGAGERCDVEEVERWLSAFYTTERERSVMDAALRGTPLPPAESLTGNSVELF